ncbi:MAG TPA: GNAT family N-acetyltransferase [Chloroflexia bacterium]
MAQDTLTEEDIPQELGDGLVMRKARPEDREALADFHANNLLDIGEVGPNEGLHTWMLDLMSGEHPTLRPGDFVLVEDTNAGKIVSSMGHFSQIWTYDGIPFKFGQPEIVSTNPDYRRRRLVRAQFNEVHRWSALRGELVQGITGIPWYYRQFGYEMTVNLGGGRTGFKPHVPKLKEGEEEPYRFRHATTQDVPLFLEMYQQAASRSMLASLHDEALWRYNVEGRSEKSDFRVELRVIETPEGQTVGALAHSRKLRGGRLAALLYEVKPGVSLLATTDSVIRYLAATGEEYGKRDGEEFEAFGFALGEQHPVYDTVPERLPRIRKPYAWYIRVPDLPAFVRHIAPALEKRLAGSPQSGYTGELKINFYRSGLVLRFEAGSISVEGWKPDRVEEGDAAFPDLTFLQLLFGYRSLEELQHAFADCSANTATGSALLPILFPKKVSNVWAGG